MICLLSFSYLSISKKFLQVKIKWNDIKIYFGIIFLSIILVTFSYIEFSLKFPILFLSLIFVSSFCFKKSLEDTFITTFLIFLLSTILECLIIIFVPILSLKLTLTLSLICNIIINIIIYFMIENSNIKKIRNYLINNGKRNYLILFVGILFIFYIINFLYIKKSVDSLVLFIVFNSIILLFIILIIKLLLEKYTSEKIVSDNNKLLEMINNYERLLDEQRVLNHENKNQLLMIKTFINDKKVNNYIDSLLRESNHSISQDFLTNIQDIPFFIVKSFLYTKYFDAKNYGVGLKLEVGRNVRTISEDSLTDDEIQYFLKILGVFLDNAIEALEKMEVKEVKVNIFKNKEDKMIISIANVFEGTIDLTKDLKGTTTKGKGHGYGLLLVNDILKKCPRIKNTTEVISNIFIQNILIDLK